MTSGVTASGTLRYVNEQKIGFPRGGRLTAIKVKLGDRVAPGQPVAEVENLEQRIALRKAEKQVEIERLKLAQVNASNKTNAPSQERRDNARQLETARKNLRETNDRNSDLIDRAEKKLDFDRDEVERFQARLDEDKPCLQVDSDPPPLGESGIQPTQECIDRVRADKDALKAAKATVLQDKADLELARNTYETDRLDRQLTIDEKTKDRNLAGNIAEFEQTDRPFNIGVQRLAVDVVLADLELARKAFQDTIKPSSYSGVVDQINGQVGQVLAASHSTLAPGAKRAQGPAGADLIVLKDVNAYQVVVPFPEATGSRITPDKTVEVTFEEIPGLTSQARIAAIEAPAPDAPSKTYLVTAVLDENDPRLRDGLSSRVAVALDRVDDTLVAPAAAVQVNGRVGLVTVRQPDGVRRDVPVELGMVGDRMIEILSGVRENDQVVVNPGS